MCIQVNSPSMYVGGVREFCYVGDAYTNTLRFELLYIYFFPVA